MNIKHVDRLSWFSRKGESHEQDGEALCRARDARAKTASGDPAMALIFFHRFVRMPWQLGT
jgi:hypothetical protein